MNPLARPSSTPQWKATVPRQIVGADQLFVDFWKKIPPSPIIFLFFFSIYAFTMSGWLQFGGEMEKYRVAQSIVEQLDLSIRPIATRSEVGLGGRTFSVYELGQTILEVPFYALGRLIYTFYRVPDVNQITLLTVGLLTSLITALTCVLLYQTCTNLGFGHRTALGLTLLFGLGTIAWVYSKNFDREPLLGLLILLSFNASYRFRQTKKFRWLFTAGFVVGYLVFTKFIQAIVIPFLAAYIALGLFEKGKQLGLEKRALVLMIVKGLTLFLLPILILLGFQSIYALARFGTVYGGIAGSRLSVLETILNEVRHSKPTEAIVGLFFSTEHSIFFYSPPTILFLFTWFKWFRKNPTEALLLFGLVLAEFISAVFRFEWWGGPRWGPRYVVQITPLLIIPLGALESSNNSVRQFWKALGIVLFALGFAVQFVGVFTNERDYLDITGRGPWLAGQIDFLRHGALDSLMLYLSPTGSLIPINPYGILLISVAALFGIWIVQRIRRIEGEPVVSGRFGAVLLALVLLIEFGAFIAWMVAPYPRVLAAKANTQFVAGNLFLADARKCEAAAMYRLALERGTTYQRQAIARLDELMPHARGVPISADDLMRHQERSANATIQTEEAITISGEEALQVQIPFGEDEIARAVSDPLPVLPNSTYELSGWLKTENVYGSGYAVIAVYEDDGNWGNPRGTDIASLDETTGWRPFRQAFTTLATTKRLFIAAGLWKTYGTVWVDGVQLAQITKENLPLANPRKCN